ncbi:MAG: anti-sigma factor antagonist [Nitrospirae bacterium]|nr:MAG: anti-sigma factor antagonist [Nitrospirota bacterium]
MEINIREYEGGKVIAVSGEIDLYSSPLLRKQLMVFVKKKESPLLVDFGGVSYIDSSGIATFVEGLKGVMSFGGRMKMFGIRPAIMEIFSFSKLDKVFEIYGTIDDAADSR